MSNYAEVDTNSKNGVIYNDEHNIQISECWSGDVLIQVKSESKSQSIFLGCGEIHSLIALLLGMELIDHGEIELLVNEIDLSRRSIKQQEMKF